LLTEVVREVERRRRSLLADLNAAPDADRPQAAWRFWEQLCDPGLASQERLFFEVYGQALQGRTWAEPLLEGVVDDWIEPMAEMLRANGVDPSQAPVHARLAVAVARGLLLDLLATGDTEAVYAAMKLFVGMTSTSAKATAFTSRS
jgi:AcrR family transcriptional regulator